MAYTTEQLDKKFKELPEDLKNIMVSVETAKIMTEIGKEFGLHIDQTGKMADQTGLVLLGLMMPTEFVSALSSELGIERLRANQLANKINEKVFYKVRESLKTIREKNKGPKANEIISGIPDKEELLAGIENPESIPVNRRFSVPEKQTPPIQPETKKEEVPKNIDIFQTKTTENTTLPKTTTQKGPDPYKEAI